MYLCNAFFFKLVCNFCFLKALGSDMRMLIPRLQPLGELAHEGEHGGHNEDGAEEGEPDGDKGTDAEVTDDGERGEAEGGESEEGGETGDGDSRPNLAHAFLDSRDMVVEFFLLL